MKQIAVIGAGTIGLRIIQAVEEEIPNAVIAAVMARTPEKARSALTKVSPRAIPVYSALDDLLARGDLDLVVEAAHPQAAQDCVKAVLGRGVDFMPMSVGGLIADGLLEEAAKIARENGAELIVPCGAVTGLNVAACAVALKTSDLYEASITSTKHPSGLASAPFFAAHPEIHPESLEQAEVLFEGTVPEAVELFPQNVNIAASLAINGAGLERTRVRVIADPRAPRTRHQVSLRGAFGEAECTLTLNVCPNGRSACLAVLSGIAAVKKYCSPIKLGY